MERENAGPGPEEAMSAAGKPGEIEFLRLDEDGKHARKVPIRVVSQPAEPGTPNPVRIRVRYASENEETTVTANGKPVPPKVAAELALIRERADRVDELAHLDLPAGEKELPETAHPITKCDRMRSCAAPNPPFRAPDSV